MRTKRHAKDIFEVIVSPFDQSYIYLCFNEMSLKETIPEMNYSIDQLISTSREGLIMFYKNGEIIDCDHSLARMFHYTVNAFKQLSLTSLVHENEQSDLLQLIGSQSK